MKIFHEYVVSYRLFIYDLKGNNRQKEDGCPNKILNWMRRQTVCNTIESTKLGALLTLITHLYMAYILLSYWGVVTYKATVTTKLSFTWQSVLDVIWRKPHYRFPDSTTLEIYNQLRGNYLINLPIRQINRNICLYVHTTT